MVVHALYFPDNLILRDNQKTEALRSGLPPVESSAGHRPVAPVPRQSIPDSSPQISLGVFDFVVVAGRSEPGRRQAQEILPLRISILQNGDDQTRVGRQRDILVKPHLRPVVVGWNIHQWHTCSVIERPCDQSGTSAPPILGRDLKLSGSLWAFFHTGWAFGNALPHHREPRLRPGNAHFRA